MAEIPKVKGIGTAQPTQDALGGDSLVSRTPGTTVPQGFIHTE